MKTLTIIFKNKDKMTIPLQFVEGTQEKGERLLLRYNNLTPQSFFIENRKILVKHNMSIANNIFSFTDVGTLLYNMSDCIPNEIAVAVCKKNKIILDSETFGKVGYVD